MNIQRTGKVNIKNITFYIVACILSPLLVITQTNQANSVDNFQGILGSNTKLERLVGNFRFTEGPVWNPSGYLLFSDIPADTIYKLTPDKKVTIFRQPSGHSNGNTLDKEKRLISTLHDRRLIRIEKDGKITILAERYQGKRLNSPNDVVVKSGGSIYFTDPPYGITKQQEELGFYGVWRLAPNGTLTLLSKEMIRPNGLAFSPDEKKLYVSDSQQQLIRVFEVKPDGTLTSGKVFAQMAGNWREGVPDGMKVDVQGNVYCSGEKGVWVFSPTGKLLGKILVPEVVTNLAWGDADYKTMYITASKSIYRIRLNIAGIQPSKSIVSNQF